MVLIKNTTNYEFNTYENVFTSLLNYAAINIFSYNFFSICCAFLRSCTENVVLTCSNVGCNQHLSCTAYPDSWIHVSALHCTLFCQLSFIKTICDSIKRVLLQASLSNFSLFTVHNPSCYCWNKWVIAFSAVSCIPSLWPLKAFVCLLGSKGDWHRWALSPR